jgi:hypothetical protein
MAEVGGKLIGIFASNLADMLAAQPSPPSADEGAGDEPEGELGQYDLGESVESLDLPLRSYNSLRREGIHTVDDLSARTEGELLAIENLGPQSVSQIKDRLADVGRHLAQPAQESAAVGAATATAAPSAGSSADGAATAPAAAPGPWADGSAPPRGARPPDEDAIDLLSVAGFPVLKRALPVIGAVVVLLVLLGILRRGRRPGPQ